MKSLTTATIIGIALLAATPVVHRSQALCAQAASQPREDPRPQPSQPAPRQDPPPTRPNAPATDRPAPPPPPPPQSTGEPELKRRNP